MSICKCEKPDDEIISNITTTDQASYYRAQCRTCGSKRKIVSVKGSYE